MDPERSIGQRVGDIRRARGINRDVLADAVGKSPDWLKSIELGRRQLDRYSTILQLAEALEVEPTELMAVRRPGAKDPETQRAHLAIPQLRKTLYRAQLPTIPVGAPIPLDDLRRRLNQAHRLRRHAHYGDLAADLPLLLTDTASTAALTEGPGREAAHRLLAEARHAAAMMTKKLGYVDLASIAAAQAIQAAAIAGDPLLITAMEWTQAEVCMTAGATEEASAITERGLDTLDGLLTDDDAGAWSLWGTLHLVRSVIEAQRKRQAEAAEHLVEAATAADRVGEGHSLYMTEFGPGNRAIHVTHVALELGGGIEALDRIAGVDLSSLPKERRARHGIDRALAYSRDGDDAQAMDELVTADRIAPEAVRSHTLAHEMVITAARRSRAAIRPVADAARRLGISV